MHCAATRIPTRTLTRVQWARLQRLKAGLNCHRAFGGSAYNLNGAQRASVNEDIVHVHLPKAERAHCAQFPRRTHTCGALTSADADSRVVLMGWLLPERKLNKKLSFFSLKDSYGSTQLVVSNKIGENVLQIMRDVPTESTVLVEGTVRARPEGQRRPVPAGDIEVIVDRFTLLNPADRNLPFMPSDSQNMANEELRLRYRYLDLRRSVLTDNLRKRSEVARIMRCVFHDEAFTEVETPMLLKSTPEGAREFLVPTRIVSAPGTTSAPAQSADVPSQPLFYALPQSPQQPKQLLVVSGAIDRYFQLARCFRDEDGRKDRQPEFTQVDLEMAWVSWGEQNSDSASAARGTWNIGGVEVRDVVEELIHRVWSTVEGVDIPHFQVMTYEEAMGRFGSDKPDLRFGLEILDITALLPASIRDALSGRGEIIELLVVGKHDSLFSRAATDVRNQEDSVIERIDVADGSDATWLARSRLLSEVAAVTEPVDHDVNAKVGLGEGGTAWLVKRSRRPEGGSTALGRLRLDIANAAHKLGDLPYTPEPKFLWVTEFPLFTQADADKEFLAHGRRSSTHHPFTAPMWQDIDKMYEGRFDEVRGQHYDLVLNGVEIGGGSVRIHDAAMQEYIFTHVLQLDEREKSSFHHLLHALRCGAPPHGGFAFGFDRLMAILCKTESIRDVIAFPKTGAGTDLLFRSPASADPEVLDQYGIQPTH